MSSIPGVFAAGGVAGCGAVIASHPFETVKIRMQLQGELRKTSSQTRIYNGPLHGLKVILRNEGIRGIYSGFGAGSAYQLLLNGSRIGFYEPIRSTLTSLLYADAKKQSFGINVFSGALSGIIGAVLGSPFFLVKTRMQTYSRVAPMGTQYVYKSTWDALRRVYRVEGLRGLYRGCDAAILRTGVGSSAQLPCYYAAKRVLVERMNMKEGTGLHLVGSSISGCAVCCLMHPVDTIMARMYNQNGTLYRGIFDCLTKTVMTEGLLACYKGFLPHLARILPHTVLTLTIAEQAIAVVKTLERKETDFL
ncbi:Mitochondrial oxaloacetate carrier protein [Cadophora gregata]|uniref:Mitochondrial oxaloacetate carrier protein n=1 Tax=Cadophora gregata TaxID=51156 RepID=UPI0026DAD674|nr:Mitochondrial oxaloacetate carrier protein [Cadophora gregata]KAK0101084.1 Mitochondrial oxaloacetate carrier protein [Cadophora gregata f. sp. sojae]KAK0115885.1 Mitochondrial oxaloacetate carrier protein [Cadophora gregata]